MTAVASEDLATKVVDLASITLREIRSARPTLVDSAIRDLTNRILRGENTDSIQDQRQ